MPPGTSKLLKQGGTGFSLWTSEALEETFSAASINRRAGFHPVPQWCYCNVTEGRLTVMYPPAGEDTPSIEITSA